MKNLSDALIPLNAPLLVKMTRSCGMNLRPTLNWKDMAKTQNAYNKLMCLTMQGYDINMYNATFEHLTSTAE
jgi:hypothetical protein